MKFISFNLFLLFLIKALVKKNKKADQIYFFIAKITFCYENKFSGNTLTTTK